MKTKFFLFLLTISLVSCDKFSSKTKQTAEASTASVDGSVQAAVRLMPKTTMSFDNDTFDFGKIKEGTIAEHTYTVKNTGKEPLLISDCKASCGCTIPAWPKDPIAPGDEGKIEVKFNSTHKDGEVSKAITVTANTEPEQIFITIKGFVIKDEKPAQ